MNFKALKTYSTYSAEQIKTLTLHSQLESSSIFIKVPQKGVCVLLRMDSKMLANSTIHKQEFKRINPKDNKYWAHLLYWTVANHVHAP